MLKVGVCLEHGDACEQLEHDAPYAPQITGVRPSVLKHNLGSSVVTSRNCTGVMLRGTGLVEIYMMTSTAPPSILPPILKTSKKGFS